jgi:outer membrane protein assembly factor BamA
MVRRACIIVLWLGVLACGVRTAEAQDAPQPLGQTVLSVRFEVEGRVDTGPALHALSSVRVGAPLSQADVRQTIERIDSLAQYENIIPTATIVPGGVELTFHLIPRHPVTQLEVRMSGESTIDAAAVRERIQQRYGGVPATVRTRDVQQAAEQILQDAGHLDATVEAATELQHDPDTATLVLTVSPGPLARIRRADVRGSSPIGQEQVLDRTGAEPGLPFRRRDIETALQTLEEDLRGRGFYEAQVTLLPPSIEGSEVDLVIAVDTGPRVELRVRPENALPRGGVDTLIPIRRVGSADQDLLEDSEARIEAALKAEGYWRASASFTRELLEDGQLLLITYSIERGPRYLVDRVDLPSTTSIPAVTLRELIGMRQGDTFDESRFLSGLARVADEYRRHGYYEVTIEPSYEEVPARSTAARAYVVLHPNIAEGPRGVIQEVRFEMAADSRMPEAALRAEMDSTPGRPYVQSVAADDRGALLTLYLNRGFRSADVTIEPVFAEGGRAVSLVVKINEGRQVFIGDISIVGNAHVSERAIRDELGLAPGDPAGAAALAEAQRRIAQMGVFRRVRIDVVDRIGGEPRVPLIVSVVESPDTTLGFLFGLEAERLPRAAAGGGFEDHLAFSPRGSFEIGRRNLGGRNRSVNLFSRVSFKPRVASGDPTRDGRGFAFTEYRINATYRERRAFRSDTDMLVGVTSEQAVRTAFNFVRNGATAEFLRRVNAQVNLFGAYRFDVTRLVDDRIPAEERPLIDRAFPQVRLSLLSSGLTWDRRDDPLSPSRGTLVTADVEMASETLGSQVGYVKGFLQGSAFHALDAARRTILAGRAQVGLARGFKRTVPVIDEDGAPVLGPDGDPLIQEVEDLPVSSRFFAGGGTTVRGFQLDRLGVPDVLNRDGLSLGGNALVVLNVELRRFVTTVFGSGLSVVGFADSGNVFARVNQLAVSQLRSAAGAGVRIDTPLGPVRLDFGFKLDRRVINEARERGWEYHLSIGEAF